MAEGAHISAAVTLRVRYAETDQMGVVYHANYITWFHEARDALFRKIGVDVAGMERQGWQFPVTEVFCRYHHPARYGDEIQVRADLEVENVARLAIFYRVRHARTGRLLATGHTVNVVTDRRGRLLIRLPDVLQTALARFLQGHDREDGKAGPDDRTARG